MALWQFTQSFSRVSTESQITVFTTYADANTWTQCSMQANRSAHAEQTRARKCSLDDLDLLLAKTDTVGDKQSRQGQFDWGHGGQQTRWHCHRWLAGECESGACRGVSGNWWLYESQMASGLVQARGHDVLESLLTPTSVRTFKQSRVRVKVRVRVRVRD